MKKLLFLLSVLFLLILKSAVAADIYCPQVIYCSKGYCSSSSDPSDMRHFNPHSFSSDTKDDYYGLITAKNQDEESSCLYEGGKGYEIALLKPLYQIWPDLNAAANDWKNVGVDEVKYKCHPLGNCPFTSDYKK